MVYGNAAWKCEKSPYAIKINDSDYQQEISKNGDDATDVSELCMRKNNWRKENHELELENILDQFFLIHGAYFKMT